MVGVNKGDVTDFIAKLSLRNERALMEKEKEIENQRKASIETEKTEESTEINDTKDNSDID